jgi:hypothetical protein
MKGWLGNFWVLMMLSVVVVSGTDNQTHDEQRQAIAAYIRWRNSHAKPQKDFAIHSKIRSPDYRAMVSR